MTTTQLTVLERASVALGSSKAEMELAALALKSKSITAVTSPDGRTECHSAAMTAKAARIGIEKAGKAARDDATQFSKAVIAEEKRLIELIAPEENRLIALRDEWDEKIAAEKAAKAEAERIALVAIMQRLAAIKSWPLLAADVKSDSVLDEIEHLEAMEIDDSFKTYYGEAVESKASSLAKLREIYAAKVRAEQEALRIRQEQEAEAARLQAEREELAKLRAEKEAREAEEKKVRDAEFERLQRIREEIAAQQLLMAQEKAAAEKREADQKAQMAEHERLVKEREAERIAKEQEAAKHVVVEPEPKLAEVLERLPLSAAVIAQHTDNHDTSWKIAGLVADMDEHERCRVLQFCERLIEQRKEAA